MIVRVAARSRLIVGGIIPWWQTDDLLSGRRWCLRQLGGVRPEGMHARQWALKGTRLDPVFAIDDPRAEGVRALMVKHSAFGRSITPPDHVHALNIEGLLDPAVTFFSVRRAGVLLGVGALGVLPMDVGDGLAMVA